MFVKTTRVPNWTLRKLFFFIFLFLTILSSGAQNDPPEPELVGNWESLITFTIGQDEDFLVLLKGKPGNYQLVETSLNSGKWETPSPIEAFNKEFSSCKEIGGLSLYYNNQMLFFHAEKPATKTGTDLFFMEKEQGKWQPPRKFEGPFNTRQNELCPSVSPGMDRIFFIRRIQDNDFRKPNDKPACGKLFVSSKTPDDKWAAPFEMYQIINTGCLSTPSIGIDGQTLVYSSVNPDKRRYAYDVLFTRETLKDVWTAPDLIESISSKEQNLSPQVAGDHLYFLRRDKSWGNVTTALMAVPLPEELKPHPTKAVKGKIIGQEDQKPVKTRLEVLNATTLKKQGVYYSSEVDGHFEMPLLTRKNYIVNIRKKGYSFASFMASLRENETLKQPGTIELFQEVEMELSVFDNEIYRPLEANVKIVDATDESAVFEGKKKSTGRYSFTLPLGRKYKVDASCEGFEPGGFTFDLLGDIIFSEFKRNLPLKPLKRDFEVFICDSETGDPIAADLQIENLDREEELQFEAENVKNGLITTQLRENDRYEFTVDGVKGYSFYNETLDLSKSSKTRLRAELVSLKQQVAIRLNNILFSFNSAMLSSESFPELNRVIKLLKDNPDIRIEIAAHTDNVGSAEFNKVLSERRAESVVDYLLENGVAPKRLKATGYGQSDPLVPNTSEENRALNRRVEFRILENEEAKQNQNPQ